MNAPHTETFLTLQEIVAAARANTAPGPWSYLIGGAETETTVRRNRLALDSIAFRPRVLRDVSRIDASATFSRQANAPAGHARAHRRPGIHRRRRRGRGGAAARRSSACRRCSPRSASPASRRRPPPPTRCASSSSTCAATTPGWTTTCSRAKDNGYTAFCLTVDVAMYSRRERDLVGRFVKPWRATAPAGSAFQSGLSWDQVKRFKDKHDLPLIIKGIATAEDAEIALQHGVEVIYVSNHGGRQLDHGLGSAAVLPEVVAAVAGRAEVWVDGGFMRGTDVVKAIALGAKHGRPRPPALPRPGRRGRAGPGARAGDPRKRSPHLPRPARRHLLRRAHAAARRRRAAGGRARRVQRLSAARRSTARLKRRLTTGA